MTGELAALPNSVALVVRETTIEAVSPEGARLWTSALPEGEKVVAPPATAPDSTIFLRMTDSVVALSASGKRLWHAPLAAPTSEFDAIVALGDSTAAALTADSTIVAFDREGRPRWSFALPEGDEIVAEPRVAPNSYLYLLGRRRLYAVDVRGRLIWKG